MLVVLDQSRGHDRNRSRGRGRGPGQSLGRGQGVVQRRDPKTNLKAGPNQRVALEALIKKEPEVNHQKIDQNLGNVQDRGPAATLLSEMVVNPTRTNDSIET